MFWIFSPFMHISLKKKKKRVISKKPSSNENLRSLLYVRAKHAKMCLLVPPRPPLIFLFLSYENGKDSKFALKFSKFLNFLIIYANFLFCKRWCQF